MKNSGPENIQSLFQKKGEIKKPPAYQWQELALQVIAELGVPGHKRNSVFKVCKQYSKERVIRALTDTKELCKDGECWKYFFKVIENK